MPYRLFTEAAGHSEAARYDSVVMASDWPAGQPRACMPSTPPGAEGTMAARQTHLSHLADRTGRITPPTPSPTTAAVLDIDYGGRTSTLDRSRGLSVRRKAVPCIRSSEHQPVRQTISRYGMIDSALWPFSGARVTSMRGQACPNLIHGTVGQAPDTDNRPDVLEACELA